MPGIAYLNTVSDYIHKRGMIHHDINLEKVLVGQEDSPFHLEIGDMCLMTGERDEAGEIAG